MKPISLTISAFGPYSEKMEPIDFTQFDSQGIFLITGDTGAGKTTIFDAMAYALYAEASGGRERRSILQKSQLPQWVSFLIKQILFLT